MLLYQCARRLSLCSSCAGSPIIFGNTDAAPNSRGRNKRLTIVPAGYSWATSPNQVGA